MPRGPLDEALGPGWPPQSACPGCRVGCGLVAGFCPLGESCLLWVGLSSLIWDSRGHSQHGHRGGALGPSGDKASGHGRRPEFAHLVSPPPSAPIYPVAVCGHLMAQRADWSSAGGSSLPWPLLRVLPGPIPIPDKALPRVSQEPEALIFSSFRCCSRIAEES